jgi:hypothetical protein
MTKKQSYGLLILLGVSLALSAMYCPPVNPAYEDTEFFRYCGWALLRGQVPYRDFFDHKPPLIYFFNAAGVALGHWGLWMITTSFALVVTGLFYRLCCRYRLPYPWVLPLLFNLMLRDNLISNGINFTREYSTYFVMLFFLVMMGRSRARHLLLGFFAGLVFFMQQEQLLILAPFFICLLWEKDGQSVRIRLLHWAAGFCLVALPLIGFFAARRSLGFFWTDAYLVNLNTYIREYKSPGDHFRAVKYILDAGNYEIPFMLALILGISALLSRGSQTPSPEGRARNGGKPLVLASLFALPLSMAAEWMGGRLAGTAVFKDVMGYFLPVSASVCILLFSVFAFSGDPAFTSRRIQLPYILLLCSSLVYTAFQHATHLTRRNYGQDVTGPEAAFLDRQSLSDYQLYIMWDEDFATYYNQRKILCPSRFFYQHFWTWYPAWDPDHHDLESIAASLLHHHTTWLLMDPADLARMKNAADRDWWRNFIQTHYHRISLPGKPDSNLWQINDP